MMFNDGYMTEKLSKKALELLFGIQVNPDAVELHRITLFDRAFTEEEMKALTSPAHQSNKSGGTE